MAALAGTLQKASLLKKDLELELDELEVAAMMVEEEEGDSRSASTSHSDSSSESSDSSSSSSDSSDDSEESEAEGLDCTNCTDGGGGGGGETAKANPLQLQPTFIPKEPLSALTSVEGKPEAHHSASASVDCSQLIQELGERVSEELRISQPSSQADRNGSQPPTAAASTGLVSGTRSVTFLEPSPRRNPLLIVQTQEDLDESDLIG